MTYEESLGYLKNLDPLRITVSGEIGAGKSTFAKHLATELDVPRIYVGGLMREEATKLNLTLDDFNKLLVSDDEVDRRLDALQKEKSKEISRGVFEGRTAWHFVENPDVRIFLGVKPKIAAERIWNDENGDRDKYESVEEIVKANVERKANEIKRYGTYYNIDVYSKNNFDVMLETSEKNIEEVFNDGVIQVAEFVQNS